MVCVFLSSRPSVMIDTFATSGSEVARELLDLHPAGKHMTLLIPKFARDADFKGWRTSESGH